MPDYKDIEVGTAAGGRIGVIRFNRPRTLNAMGGSMMSEYKRALRAFDRDPDTVVTVVTGNGRGFNSGADVTDLPSLAASTPEGLDESAAREFWVTRFATAIDVIRDMVDHRKILVMAVNGPSAGAGAAWFLGVADMVIASTEASMVIPFSRLAVAPEGGIASIFPESMGWRRAVPYIVWGDRMDAETMERLGLANFVLPAAGFMDKVLGYLTEKLDANDAGSVLLAKKLMADPLREKRKRAVVEAMTALAERFASGAPKERTKTYLVELKARNAARKTGKL
ncbi:ClpP/crotonase-like domain-containing protein [Hyaloraphidium curvatum]|nr:ClpP/crotonase-like domain-containing protein [Hyaloraphidium curvatum]